MRKRVGQYNIQQPNRPIGHGQSAAVYLATHVDAAQEVVALKFFHVFAPEKRVQRIFLRETQIITRLDHPNIIRVLHVGFDKNNPYYVMSYALGGNLKSKIKPGSSMSPEEVDVYLQQIAKAIQHVHDNGLVHCDLKPENVLIAADGRLLLADFGITRSIQTIQAQSTQGAAGTPLYMAPEQFAGKPDVASDQYALGILVYELLSGRTPFTGSTSIELMGPHLRESPPSLTAKNPAVSPRLEAVIFRALEKKAANRFPSVLDFANAFHDAIQGPVETSSTDPLIGKEMEGQVAPAYYSCFICCSDEDHEFAVKLYTDLQSRGVDCYLVPKGASFSEYNQGVTSVAFRKGEKFLLIISEHALANKVVDYVTEAVLARERNEHRDIILPIYRDRSIMQATETWAVAIRRSRLLGNFEEWPSNDYSQSLNQLMDSLIKIPTSPELTVFDQEVASFPTQTTLEYYTCMIAYSARDYELARKLYTDLQNNGVRCWFAHADMRPGERFLDTIEKAIRIHDKVLLILSEHSIRSAWVESEAEAALDRERRELREIIFPIRLIDVDQLSGVPWVAPIIRQKHVLDFMGWQSPESYERLLNRMLRDLRVKDN